MSTSLGDVTLAPEKKPSGRSSGKSPIVVRRISDKKHVRNISISSKDKKKYHQKKSNPIEMDDSESESMESEQTDSQDSKSSPNKSARLSSKGSSEWQILEGLRAGQVCEQRPKKYEGYLMKRRKWPLKGWHKRYFALDKGILSYGKNSSDLQKGKLHGTVDIGLSVLSYKSRGRRIDIDAEDVIYHLKVKTTTLYDEWIKKYRSHRLYRQHEIAYGTSDAPKLTDVPTPVEDFTPASSPMPQNIPFTERRRGSLKGSFKGRQMERSQSKVAAWLLDSQGMEQCSKDLTVAQAKIFELNGLLEKLRQSSLLYGAADSGLELSDTNSFKKEKSGKKGGWKKKDKKSPDCLMVPNGTEKPIHMSSSNPNLLSHDPDRTIQLSTGSTTSDNLMLAGRDPKIQELKMQEDFLETATSVHEVLRTLSRTIATERDRLRNAFVQHDTSTLPGSANYVFSLRQSLQETLKHNQELQTKLNKINEISGGTGYTPSLPSMPQNVESILKEQFPILATSGSWESTSEFYDAAEYLRTSSETSEGSDEEDVSSDVSDTDNTATSRLNEEFGGKLQTGRRSKLPVPKPDAGDVSLWSLLCKNIGKDLSKISMPVTLNEPLSMLQRICEELEYSELLDQAADTDDPYLRMVMVVAFSVSPYAATYYRAGQKPFNPLLGETYECIREDKGWSFIGEQVSHHPPISACFCESKNFIFWQDVKVKTKFWGKSMEIQPIGTVHLKLPKHQDHYTWNKATTCVHNLLGGQRWVDHYGEVIVENHTRGIKCKLTYAKSSYWSERRHEVYGSITGQDGAVVHQVFGKWNEGFYYGHAPSAKCIWRPGSFPEDFDLYYGFTRLAIELNEIDNEQVLQYAPTDSRFRPDQRNLEEGKIQEAENIKQRVEQLQRERKKAREEEKVVYSPKWFMKNDEDGKEIHTYTGKYWELRKNPGFSKIQFPKLW